MLLAYNQSMFIDEAIGAALKQVGDPIEIMLSDDASSDSTYDKMCKAAASYSGPHKVITRRSATNRGMLQHLMGALPECSGDFIILAAGDDISEPHRTARLLSEWREIRCGPAVIYSDWIGIDLNGRTVELPHHAHVRSDSLAKIARGETGPLGATCAITRSLISDFEPINPDVTFEDRVFPFRALLLGGQVRFVNEELVRYRVGAGVSHDVPSDLRGQLTHHAVKEAQPNHRRCRSAT